MGVFKRFGERLSETPEQLAAQETRAWCGEIQDVEQIAECRPRTRRRVAGVVESIKVIPRRDTSILEIQIYDGTDRIYGVWFGRRKILGIDLGKRIILEGTVSIVQGDRLRIINPGYELIAT